MAVYEATDENFHELIKEGVSIIDFNSTHCGPCRVLLPILMEVEAEMPFINLVKVNIDFCPKIAEEFMIMSVPTIYLYKDGKGNELNVASRDKDTIEEAVSQVLYA